MGAQGTTTVNFGAFPGTSDTSIAVTGQAGIIAGSLVEAWIFPAATADHSADEHLYETIAVRAGNIVAGTGFTIYAWNTSSLDEPLNGRGVGGTGTLLSGQWNIAWTWN